MAATPPNPGWVDSGMVENRFGDTWRPQWYDPSTNKFYGQVEQGGYIEVGNGSAELPKWEHSRFTPEFLDAYNKTNNIAPKPEGFINPQQAADNPREVTGDIIRGQWDDFKSTYLPVIRGGEGSLESMTTYAGNKGVVEGLKATGAANATNAFNNTLSTAQRGVARMGMAPDAASTASLTTQAGLQKTLSTVDSANKATQFQTDLNKQIAGGASMQAGGRSYTGGK